MAVVDRARAWLEAEARETDELVQEQLAKTGSAGAMYGFTLGQVDRYLRSIQLEAAGEGGSLERLGRLQRQLEALVLGCERESRAARDPMDRSGLVRAWAYRRAWRAIGSLLRERPRTGSGVIVRPSGLSRWVAPSRARKVERRSSMTYAHLRLLLLDDDARLRRTYEQVAEGLGVELLAVATVEQARGWIETERFDLVVCDWNLADGETSAELVRDLIARGLAVVVSTGTAAPAVTSGLGAEVRVVEKPVTLEVLLEIARASIGS